MLSEINAGQSLTFNITNIKNDNGYVLVALYNSEKGFPDKPSLTFKKQRVKAVKGTLSIVFSDIPPGKYAAGIVHDENDNQKLDTGFFGIPKEGFCFSNQAMGTVGPPSFESASISVSNKPVSQNLKMSYW
jgi:uncharacterized protein (DUF2141 family)